MRMSGVVNDVVVPAGVGVIQLVLKAWDDKRVTEDPLARPYEPIAPYIIAGVGMVARMGSIMPQYDETFKMAVAASIPRVTTGLYEWVKTPSTTATRVTRAGAARRTAMPVSRVRSSAVAARVGSRTPEFESIRIV